MWVLGLLVIALAVWSIAVVGQRRRGRLDAGAQAVRAKAVARGFRPVNAMPVEPHVLLPTGSTIQVTGEDEHFVVLRAYVAEGDVPVAVTLHAVTEERPRSTADVVEVRLDGQLVGVLSQIQTANIKPLVDFVAERGKVPVARAVVVGNAVKADMKLHVAKAQDVSQAWLDDLGGAPVEWDVYARRTVVEEPDE